MYVLFDQRRVVSSERYSTFPSVLQLRITNGLQLGWPFGLVSGSFDRPTFVVDER